MVQPINYGALQTAVNPMDAFTSAFQQGAGIMEIRDMQAARQQKMQMAEQQAQAQQAMQAELAAVANNPQATASDYSRLMTKYPALSENLKRSWDTLNADQQKNSLTSLSKVSAAFSAGKPEIAVKVLREQAEALRNSGDEAQAKRVEDIARMTEIDPSVGRSIAFSMVAAVPGGDKIIEGLGKVGTEVRAQEMQAPTLAKATAEAKTAGVTAQYAESNAIKELEKKGWDIKGIQADIDYKRAQSRIAAMTASLARESNDLKRQELQLKVNEAVTARDEKIRNKVADVETVRSTIDNLLNTADRVLKNPQLGDVLGSIEGRLPAILSDEEADAVAMIDTLGAQTFLAQIPSMKGTGALSEKEGDKLQASLQNLSRTQSQEQFTANLKEAQRLMLKARKTLSTRYGVPETPADTPDVPIDTATIDALVNKYK